jgi:hypothetical protein
VQRTLSAFLDHGLPCEEAGHVSKHLLYCRDCAAYSEQLVGLQKALRNMPSAAAPPQLSLQLRILASRERARRLTRITGWSLLRSWREKAVLAMDNLMRPIALPLAGGLLSAIFLFGVLVPTLEARRNILNDVPYVIYQQATVDSMAPFGFTDNEVVVELTIDERGFITDYSVPKGKLSKELSNDIGNMILFTSFTPAALSGQPTAGKVLVSFRRSHINIKG